MSLGTRIKAVGSGWRGVAILVLLYSFLWQLGLVIDIVYFIFVPITLTLLPILILANLGLSLVALINRRASALEIVSPLLLSSTYLFTAWQRPDLLSIRWPNNSVQSFSFSIASLVLLILALKKWKRT